MSQHESNEHADTAFLVVSTVPEDEAGPLVDDLLGQRLIACANLLGPVRSRYRWEGRVEESVETVLLMKTTGGNRAALRARIAELHSYSVPEVLEFEVASGLPAYLQWVADSCAPGGG